jgi:hypothetical protein
VTYVSFFNVLKEVVAPALESDRRDAFQLFAIRSGMVDLLQKAGQYFKLVLKLILCFACRGLLKISGGF